MESFVCGLYFRYLLLQCGESNWLDHGTAATMESQEYNYGASSVAAYCCTRDSRFCTYVSECMSSESRLGTGGVAIMVRKGAAIQTAIPTGESGKYRSYSSVQAC